MSYFLASEILLSQQHTNKYTIKMMMNRKFQVKSMEGKKSPKPSHSQVNGDAITSAD